MDDMMRALATKKTPGRRLVLPCEDSLREAAKYYAKVTPIMAMLLISAYILNPFQKVPIIGK